MDDKDNVVDMPKITGAKEMFAAISMTADALLTHFNVLEKYAEELPHADEQRLAHFKAMRWRAGENVTSLMQNVSSMFSIVSDIEEGARKDAKR